jgi:hypothetical protein
MICYTNRLKKANLGGGLPITELPLAQQQQAQFRCTQLEDVVDYNAILIPNLYAVPPCGFVVICYTIMSKKRIWEGAFLLSQALLSWQLVISSLKVSWLPTKFYLFYPHHHTTLHTFTYFYILWNNAIVLWLL